MSAKYPDNIDNPDSYELLIQSAAEEGAWPLVTPLLPGNFFALDPLTPAQSARAAEELFEQMEEWEKSMEHAAQIPLRQLIGDPLVQPLSALEPAQVEAELQKILDLMAKHRIFIDFINEVAVDEAYRFIVEELLNEEVADMRMGLMNMRFIYEEFYPGDENWDEEFSDLNHGGGQHFNGDFHADSDWDNSWGDIPF